VCEPVALNRGWMAAVWCLCGVPAGQSVSKSEENSGRGFFRCGALPPVCKFFQWVDFRPVAAAGQPLGGGAAAPPVDRVFVASGGKLIDVKLSLGAVDQGPPLRIWIHVEHIKNADLETHLHMTFPAHVRRYNHQKKIWMFDLTQYAELLKRMQSSMFNRLVTVHEMPDWLVKGLNWYLSFLRPFPEANSTEKEIKLNLPPYMSKQLLPFQYEGVRFLVRHGGRGMIADEMGCGKTVQAIACILHYQVHWPALILVPSNLLDQWEEQLLLFTQDVLRKSEIRVIRTGKDSVGICKICVCSYTIISTMVDQQKVNADMFGVVLADESHHIKNKDNLRSSVVIPLLQKAKVALLLSGTPATNRPKELYSQLNALLPNLFRSYDNFTERYCDAKESRFHRGKDVEGASNTHELSLLLEGVCMIRRLKDSVLTLPRKVREIRRCEVDPQFVSDHEEIRHRLAQNKAIDLSRKTEEERNAIGHEAQSLKNEWYQLTGRSKINGIMTEVRKLVEEGRLEKERLERAADLDAQVRAGDAAADADILYESEEHSEDMRGAAVALEDELEKAVQGSFSNGQHTTNGTTNGHSNGSANGKVNGHGAAGGDFFCPSEAKTSSSASSASSSSLSSSAQGQGQGQGQGRGLGKVVEVVDLVQDDDYPMLGASQDQFGVITYDPAAPAGPSAAGEESSNLSAQAQSSASRKGKDKGKDKGWVGRADQMDIMSVQDDGGILGGGGGFDDEEEELASAAARVRGRAGAGGRAGRDDMDQDDFINDSQSIDEDSESKSHRFRRLSKGGSASKPKLRGKRGRRDSNSDSNSDEEEEEEAEWSDDLAKPAASKGKSKNKKNGRSSAPSPVDLTKDDDDDDLRNTDSEDEGEGDDDDDSSVVIISRSSKVRDSRRASTESSQPRRSSRGGLSGPSEPSRSARRGAGAGAGAKGRSRDGRKRRTVDSDAIAEEDRRITSYNYDDDFDFIAPEDSDSDQDEEEEDGGVAGEESSSSSDVFAGKKRGRTKGKGGKAKPKAKAKPKSKAIPKAKPKPKASSRRRHSDEEEDEDQDQGSDIGSSEDDAGRASAWNDLFKKKPPAPKKAKGKVTSKKPSSSSSSSRGGAKQRRRYEEEEDEDEDEIRADDEEDEEEEDEEEDEETKKSASLWSNIFNKKPSAAKGKQIKSTPATSTAKSKAKGKGKGSKLNIPQSISSTDSTSRRHRGLGKKIIIFAHHREVMDQICGCLKDEEVKFIRIDGETSKAKRPGLIHAFQTDDKTYVAVLSTKTCGTGMNLTRGSVALFAELMWSPGEILQAEDRIHRIGQQAEVRIVYLVANRSADEPMWELLQKKIGVLEETVGMGGQRKGMTIDTGGRGSGGGGHAAATGAAAAAGKSGAGQGSIDSFFPHSQPTQKAPSAEEVYGAKYAAALAAAAAATAAAAPLAPAAPVASAARASSVTSASNATTTISAAAAATAWSAQAWPAHAPAAAAAAPAPTAAAFPKPPAAVPSAAEVYGNAMPQQRYPAAPAPKVQTTIVQAFSPKKLSQPQPQPQPQPQALLQPLPLVIAPAAAPVPVPVPAAGLTDEQKARIEENKRKALEKKAKLEQERLQQQQQQQQQQAGVGVPVHVVDRGAFVPPQQIWPPKQPPVAPINVMHVPPPRPQPPLQPISTNAPSAPRPYHPPAPVPPAPPATLHPSAPAPLQPGHIFSTGTGSKVPVSAQGMKNAEALLNSTKASGRSID